MHRFFASLAALAQKPRYACALLILIHCILISFAFHRHITSPTDTLFSTKEDGLKNYFTLVTYIKEPIGKDGLFKYNSFSYPYGDYVYSTDNTPLFSIPFRWFCHYIYDLSDYTIAFFNFFILGNIILSGLLTFFIFRRLLGNGLLAWLLALFLPWTNFQVARIFNNNFNLSLTSFSLIAIALFMLWNRNSGKLRNQLLIVLAMSLFSFCCFLAHGYYIAIIPVFLGAMLFFYGLYRIRGKAGIISVIAGGLVCLLSALLTFGTMKLTDGYFSMRQDFAMGYDWMEQKTNFSLLFTHYSFHNVYFPIWIEKNADYSELMVYLGNIGLYAVALFFIISLFSRRFRLTLFSIQKDFFSSPLYAGIFFGGLIMLSMSFGEHYYPMMEKLHVTLPFKTEGIGKAEVLFLLIAAAAALAALVLFLKSKEKMAFNPLPADNKRNRIIRIMLFYLLAVIVCYAAFGHYHIDHLVNWPSPLYILHKFTRKAEQFRSMVRFAWPFYWTFYIWIMYTVAGVYQRTNSPGRKLIVILMLLLGGEETINYMDRMEKGGNLPSNLSGTEFQKLDRLKINFKDYQAILPVPYYNVGSEDYDHTIDDLGDFSPFSYRLALYSRLPMMACKLSRIPPRFSKEALDLITHDRLSPGMKRLMNDKPVLVVIDRRFIRDSTLPCVPNRELHPEGYAAYWAANSLAERNHLRPIDSLGSIYFYAWKPRQEQ